MATKLIGVEDFMSLCYSKYSNVTWNQCRDNGNVIGNQVASNEVLKGWSYFDVMNNRSNSKSTHFNRSIKLDLQDLRKKDQGIVIIFILLVSSTFHHH